jgi:membrane protease YdiL (CAAX protease family)
MIIAVIATAVLFSLYHFADMAEFQWPIFLFRALAGAYLGIMYLWRGFGVAVGAHICFDVYIRLIDWNTP